MRNIGDEVPADTLQTPQLGQIAQNQQILVARNRCNTDIQSAGRLAEGDFALNSRPTPDRRAVQLREVTAEGVRQQRAAAGDTKECNGH